MIKYKLFCESCLKKFDSWFSSSLEYEKIKKIKLLSCPHCDSKKVKKSLMTPNLSNTKKKIDEDKGKKFIDIKKKLKEYKRFVKKNFEYVGDNFAYKARTIHYNKNNKKKGIYGHASSKVIKELKEEGIDTQVLPWIDDKEN